MWERWKDLAFLTHYGGQDLFRLLGRDPMKRPLTPLEMQLYRNALYVTVKAEYETAPPPDNTDADEE